MPSRGCVRLLFRAVTQGDGPPAAERLSVLPSCEVQVGTKHLAHVGNVLASSTRPTQLIRPHSRFPSDIRDRLDRDRNQSGESTRGVDRRKKASLNRDPLVRYRTSRMEYLVL